MEEAWFRRDDDMVFRLTRHAVPVLMELHLTPYLEDKLNPERFINQPIDWVFRQLEPEQPEVGGQLIHAANHVRLHHPVKFHYYSFRLFPNEVRELELVDRGPSHLAIFGFCHRLYFAR
jgi:hypothetical protein